jgi:hypothetical protein
VRVSALSDAIAMMNFLGDASSTAANHDPGATLRRLRPPYHAVVSRGETDRGYFPTAVNGFRLAVSVSKQEQQRRTRMRVPTVNRKTVD